MIMPEAGPIKLRKIKIVDNYEMQYVEIEGIRYSYALFVAFSKLGLDLNQPFKIMKREDGMLTIEKYYG